MSLCDRCAAPGTCCKRIALFGGHRVADPKAPTPELTTWEEHGVEGAVEILRRQNIPFNPTRITARYESPDGRPYVTWEYECPNLLPNGRCGDYENRPNLCQIFEPASGPLCVHFWHDSGDPTLEGEHPIPPPETRETILDSENVQTSAADG